MSINDEIVHGIPSSRKLKEGDIVGLDFGVVYEGFYGDSARTVAVGPVPERVTRLLNVTREASMRESRRLAPGNRISDIARAVQDTVERARVFGGDRFRRTRHRPPPP